VILLLAVVVAVLYGVGTWLILQRSLSRIVIGITMLGHGANLLLLASGGRAGLAPFVGNDPAATADPLPQALALTAIVITFGVSGFLLSMAHASWLQRRDDEVEDDVEDRRIAAMHARLEADARRRATAEAATDEGVAS
jgi:multicomponent Na+:H+ antiporter subunit C